MSNKKDKSMELDGDTASAVTLRKPTAGNPAGGHSKKSVTNTYSTPGKESENQSQNTSKTSKKESKQISNDSKPPSGC